MPNIPPRPLAPMRPIAPRPPVSVPVPVPVPAAAAAQTAPTVAPSAQAAPAPHADTAEVNSIIAEMEALDQRMAKLQGSRVIAARNFLGNATSFLQSHLTWTHG